MIHCLLVYCIQYSLVPRGYEATYRLHTGYEATYRLRGYIQATRLHTGYEATYRLHTVMLGCTIICMFKPIPIGPVKTALTENIISSYSTCPSQNFCVDIQAIN